MHLTIHERLVLASILPAEGNFLLMKRRRELREALTHFTDTERAEYGLHEDEIGIHWTPEAAVLEFDIAIDETMAEAIRKTLRDLDTNQALTDDLLSLYEKFVGG